MTNGLLRKFVIVIAISGSALCERANSANWSSISDIVPQIVGESINYSSSTSSILPNKLTAIFYVVDPADNNPYAIGGFDLQNGVVTKGYYNRDSATEYGLMDGDTANSGSNPENSYYKRILTKVFYDLDGSFDFNAPYNGYFLDDTEELDPSQYSITGFTPYGTEPATFTFTATIVPEFSSLSSFGFGITALGDGTNRVTLSVIASNMTSFSVQYKTTLTNETWQSLGTYSKTGEVTSVIDTNTTPQRFYRVVSP